MSLAESAVLRKTENIPYRVIEGEAVLVNVKTHEVIHLNETGSFVWEAVDGVRTAGDIVRALLCEFEVDEAQARADVEEFAAGLIEKGLMSVSG